MAASVPGAGAGIPAGRKLTAVELVGGIFCNICKLTFENKKDFDTHYLSHGTKKEEITYTCVVCSVPFNSYPSFRGHCYNIHYTKNRFKCQYCHKLLSKQAALKIHIRTMHTNNYKCNFKGCDIQFSTKEDMHLHQVTHINAKPPYPCQTCGDNIDSILTCEDHIDQHCTFTYHCPICEEIIAKNEALKHLATHFGNKVLSEESMLAVEADEMPEDCALKTVGGILCCFCGKLFEDRGLIDTHFAKDHPEEDIIYSCNICGKQYEKYVLFGDHCYYHCSKARFECEQCDRAFSRLSLLVEHAEQHAGAGGGAARFQCTACPRDFASDRRRREHQRQRHDITALPCPEPHCIQQFDTPRNLVLHRKLHKSENNTWCRYCGLQFQTQFTAAQHLLLHKTKLLDCPICSRQSREKYALMKHIPKHFESTFHLCNICGKVFNAKNRLIEHVKVHSCPKVFECEYCGKGFSKAHNLKQHLNLHTGAKPYECVYCTKKFASQPNWSKHIRKIHNINLKDHNKRKVNDAVDKISIVVAKTVETKETKKSEVCTDYSIETQEAKKSEVCTDYSIETQEAKKSEVCTDYSTMDSVSVDLTILENELLSCENEVRPLSVAEITAILPEPTDEFVSEILCGETNGLNPTPAMPVEAAIPREYGPDFGDENMLPHINPQLLNNQYLTLHDLKDFQYDVFEDSPMETPEPPKWEPPVITKVYDYGYTDEVSAGRLTVLNTDIF